MFSGAVPYITQAVTVYPATGSMSLIGQPMGVLVASISYPGGLVGSFVGQQPTPSQAQYLPVGVGSASLTGYTLVANSTLYEYPATVSVVVGGNTFTIDLADYAGAGTLSVVGNPPSLSTGVVVEALGGQSGTDGRIPRSTAILCFLSGCRRFGSHR